MFLAAAALIATASPVVWRCHQEVYDLALYKGKVVAATSGGALIEGPDHSWSPLGAGGPAPFRKIRIGTSNRWPSPSNLSDVSHTSTTDDAMAQPLIEVLDRTGHVYELRNGSWMATNIVEALPAQNLPSPTVQFENGTWRSPWGGRFLQSADGNTQIPRDPAEGDYALCADGDRLLAGTPSGIYEYRDRTWAKDVLPNTLPTLRPQGVAIGADGSVVGGLSGLFVKRGRDWEQAGREPVRQILKAGAAVWVLYGSGAVDKLDLAQDQLVFDVVNQGAKRPWTSCLACFEGTMLFGGQGGWIEKGKKGVTERYYPEIDNDVVMAAAGRNDVRWIGTQKSGLFRYGEGPKKQWNPGNGLTDTWVTALLHTPDGLYVATAGEGLYLLKGDQIQQFDSPTQRPRHLAMYKGEVVVGGMDGAWIREGQAWKRLPTNGEETTAISAGDRLIICTAGGVYFL